MAVTGFRKKGAAASEDESGTGFLRAGYNRVGDLGV
jgi:hypothetical protein